MDVREREVDNSELARRIILTSPNQKIVLCHNDSLEQIKRAKERGNIRLTYDCPIHNIETAVMNNLTGNEFKLYRYFQKNQDGYEFALSPIDACSYTGLSEKAYRNAVNSLIEKGYLKQRSKPKNVYDFFVLPKWEHDAPPRDISSTPEGYIIYPKEVISSNPEGCFYLPPRAGEIIQDNTTNNTENNINNSTVDNRNTMGEEENNMSHLARLWGVSEDQAKRMIEKNNSRQEDDELPF